MILKFYVYVSVVNCGFPGYLANGYVIGQSYLFGDIVTYDCRQGIYKYKLERFSISLQYAFIK